MTNPAPSTKFGTAPVFLTAVSTILGAILFLRFGSAVGELGFWGTLVIILLGHLVTIPTALAISEIATNQKVEGGGEYFIISRSFGVNIGATIGVALYFSQAISVAFYVIAFTEAFSPLFDWVRENWGWNLPRQIISLPAMAVLAVMILKKGANLGVKALYVVVAILFVSLLLFFLGTTAYHEVEQVSVAERAPRRMDNFFLVFAIIFPAFTGMTAGVGLSGDLKDPGKSIPLGTVIATVFGMIVYAFIAWKLAVSASPEDLVNDQLIMSRIAIGGALVIPLGLAASTISSAIGSVMVAPRTLQALGADEALPVSGFNRFITKGKGATNEPYNASLITCGIAFIFVAVGDVDAVAKIISMFFMITYGSLCMISFLHHFGSDPSYRPSFRSRWYISLLGFLMCVYMMFKINALYAISAAVIMTLLYAIIHYYHRDRGGLEEIFQGAIFQLNRRLQLFLQKSDKKQTPVEKWRPAVICITRDALQKQHVFDLLSWLAYKHGFAFYIHLIEDFYSTKTCEESKAVLNKMVKLSEEKHSKVYVDTLISPSYTSAIANAIQLPSITGMENNMVLFEFSKEKPDGLKPIIDNYNLVAAGDYDVCVYGAANYPVIHKNGIHIWITPNDYRHVNLMILMSYIILGHPAWHKAFIKIFYICKEGCLEERKSQFLELITKGRLPISPKNIEFMVENENRNLQGSMNHYSADAGLVIRAFNSSEVKHRGAELFEGYDQLKHVLFVNSHRVKEIE